MLASVVVCHAAAEALDDIAIDETLPIRVSPDELLLLAAAERAGSVCTAAEAALAGDDGSIVVDVSDGHALSCLRGDWHEAYARLCAIPAADPPGCLQGLFANVPAKLVFDREELLVVVSSVLAHHLAARVLESCGDLDVAELAPASIAVPMHEATA